MNPNESPRARPRRGAAGWFLAFVVLAAAVAIWLRGGGRMLVPLALGVTVVVVVSRLVRAVRAPLP